MTRPSQPPPPASETSRGRVIAILIVLASAITFVVAVVGWKWAGSERADFAQWLMAGAAVATLAAAIAAAVFAREAFQLESERESRYRFDQRRRQAEQVAAWHDVVRAPSTDSRFRSTKFDAIMVRNASDLPVTDVEFDLRVGDYPAGHTELTVLPPANDPVSRRFTSALYEAVENAKERFAFDHDPETPMAAITIDIAFTDARGKRWVRRHGEELKPI